MDGQPFTVLGSAGQVTIHPLIAEVRSQQGLLASLLKALGLPRVTTRKPNKPRLRLEPTRPARSLTPDGTSEGTPNRHDAQEKPLPSQDRGHGPQMTMADVLRERLRLNPPDQQVVWNNCFTRQPSK